jgi:hypothetical protein
VGWSGHPIAPRCGARGRKLSNLSSALVAAIGRLKVVAEAQAIISSTCRRSDGEFGALLCLLEIVLTGLPQRET